MTLKTRKVILNLVYPDNTPAVLADVVCRLTKYEVDGLLVVPNIIIGTTDNTGRLELLLWPNSLGTNGSQYKIVASKSGAILLNVRVTVPDGDAATEVLLESIITAQAPATVSDAQAAVLAAQALVDEATTLRDTTQGYADTVSAMSGAIQALDADLANINAVAASLTPLDAIALALTALNAVAAALTSINATALHLDNVDAVGGSISNVNAVGAAIAHVQAVSGALTAVNAVALDLTPINAVALALVAINSVATDLSAINSLAGDLVAVNAVNINASNINTVAGAATSVTAVAGAISAVNAVSAALTAINSVSAALTAIGTVSTNIASVNAVSGVAANVTTVAGISDNVTTVAGISGNVTTVAGISANVTSVAGIAAAVSTNAANITAIQNAAANASSAGTSATNAANSYIAFANRFLGAKSSAPTLDNYGGALIPGALYWDTTLNSIRAWSGSAWLDPLSNMVTETDARILDDQQLLEQLAYINDIAGLTAKELVRYWGVTDPRLAALEPAVDQLAQHAVEIMDLVGASARQWGDLEIDANLVRLTGAINHLLDLAGSAARAVTDRPKRVAAPATASSAGTTNEVAFDTGYIYVCTAANTWKRAAIATW